jgi:hypothetical protein
MRQDEVRFSAGAVSAGAPSAGNPGRTQPKASHANVMALYFRLVLVDFTHLSLAVSMFKNHEVSCIMKNIFRVRACFVINMTG